MVRAVKPAMEDGPSRGISAAFFGQDLDSKAIGLLVKIVVAVDPAQQDNRGRSRRQRL